MIFYLLIISYCLSGSTPYRHWKDSHNYQSSNFSRVKIILPLIIMTMQMSIKVDLLTKPEEQTLIPSHNHTTETHNNISIISSITCLHRETITISTHTQITMAWIIKIPIMLELKTKSRIATKQIHIFKTLLLLLLLLLPLTPRIHLF